MAKKFRYDVYITGVIDAKDEKTARTIAELSFSMNGRLLKNSNKIAVIITEVTSTIAKVVEKLKNG